jgi:hypothetical protein
LLAARPCTRRAKTLTALVLGEGIDVQHIWIDSGSSVRSIVRQSPTSSVAPDGSLSSGVWLAISGICICPCRSYSALAFGPWLCRTSVLPLARDQLPLFQPPDELRYPLGGLFRQVVRQSRRPAPLTRIGKSVLQLLQLRDESGIFLPVPPLPLRQTPIRPTPPPSRVT